MRKKKADQAQAPEAAAEASSTPGIVTPPTASSGRSDGRLTPVDIQQIEFRRSFKGYEEREVDEFLDRLTEDFAAALDENQRMRSRLESGLGAVGAADPADASRQADEIIQRARTQAAQIIRDAESRAVTIGTGAAAIATGDTPAISAFIAKERAFLQQLASLVQDHAEGVKGMVRASTASAPAPRPEPADEVAEPDPKPRAPATSPTPAQAPAPQATQAMEAVPGDAGPPESSEARKPSSQTRPTERAASPVQSQARGQDTISVPEPEPQPRPVTTRGSDSKANSNEDEQSLRELFWGDE
ncbi:MAG: DivIVA domain-containing protein [Actinomycetota bacterium]